MGAVPLPGGAEPLNPSLMLRDFTQTPHHQCSGSKHAVRRQNPLGHGPARAVSPATATLPSAALRTVLADAAMVLVQLLLFVNHLRHLMDSAACPATPSSSSSSSPSPSPSSSLPTCPAALFATAPTTSTHVLTRYPCSAPVAARLVFLITHAGATLLAAFRLPLGELWVPLVTSAILAQLALLTLLPRRVYLAGPRRACMLLVGMLPKAASLAALLAFPGERPSSYFGMYLPMEGAIVVWQHLVYNYPFWPGLAVLAAHCGLTTAICAALALRAASPGHPPPEGDRWAPDAGAALSAALFPEPRHGPDSSLSPPLASWAPGPVGLLWVVAHTHLCAVIAALVALQQNPAAVGRARAYIGRWWQAGSGGSDSGDRDLGGGDDSGDGDLPSKPCDVCEGAARESQPGAHWPSEEEGRGRASGGEGGAATGAEAQVLQVIRKVLLGAIPGRKRRALGALARSPSALSAAGSLLSSSSASASASPSEGPSAPGSGSHTDAAELAKSACQQGESAAAAAAAAGPALAMTASAAAPPALAPVVVAPAVVAAAAFTQAPPAPIAAAAAMSGPMARKPPPSIAASSTLAGPAGSALHPPLPPAGAPSLQPLPPSPLPPPLRGAAPLPPTGAFSLKQPTGLSKWTIVEDQEFTAAAVGVGVASSLQAISLMSARSRRFRRYQSRAPPQRVCMKIPWAEPDQLPSNFLERLNVALSEGLDCMAVGVAARAGCIELVFDLVPHAAAYDSASEHSPDLAFFRGPRAHRHCQDPGRLHPGQQPHPAAPGSPSNLLPPTATTQPTGLDADRLGNLRPEHPFLLASGAPAAPAAAASGADPWDIRARLQAYADADAPGPDVGPTAAALIERLRPWTAASGVGHLDSGSQSLFRLGHSGSGTGRGVREFGGGGGGGGWQHSSAPLDTNTAVEEAVLSGLMITDAEPASWIDALHLQPPPGAEVLTQACGRVWISRWDQARRQWIPEKAGGLRPSQLPRITHLDPPCILLGTPTRGSGQGLSPSSLAPEGVALVESSAPRPPTAPVLRLTVSNTDDPPSFSARCRGRYLPVTVQQIRWGASHDGAEVDNAAAATADAPAATEDDDSAFALDKLRRGGGCAAVVLELPTPGLPRNGLVIVECKVGKLVSNWRPVLVTEDALLAADLATLAAATPSPSSSSSGAAAAAAAALFDADSPHNADELLTDLGLWLDYLEVRGLTADHHGASSASSAAGRLSSSGGGDPSSSSLSSSVACTDATAGANGSGQSGVSAGSSRGAGSGSVGTLGRLTAPGSLDFGQGLVGLYGTERYRSHMAGIVVSLLEFAVDRGWTHTAALLVAQAASAGIPWRELQARCCSDGLTLLHRAVRSACEGMVRLVVELGERHGTPCDWKAVSLNDDPQRDDSADATTELGTDAGSGGGGGGVTPLHLAAALPDGGRLAERILSEYQAACELWVTAVDRHGFRPVDCARASGHTHLDLLTRQPEAEPEPEAPAEPAKAVASPGSVSSGKAATGAPAAAAAVTSRAAGKDKDAAAEAEAECCGRVAGSTSGGGGGGGRGGETARVGLMARRLGSAIVTSITAPFLHDARTEAAYVHSVGAASVLRCCCYLVYQMSLVAAVGGRMFKEVRQHEVYGMLIFFSPHVASALLLCLNYSAWLRSREALCAAVTLTRTVAKLLPVLELLPYPHSSTKYMPWGMDVALEGVVPAFFENMRGPLVLPLRALEGLVTGLLYHKLAVVSDLPAALGYALSWTLGCGLITTALDGWFRTQVAAGQGQGRRQAGAGAFGAAAAGAAAAGSAAASGGAGGSGVGRG